MATKTKEMALRSLSKEQRKDIWKMFQFYKLEASQRVRQTSYTVAGWRFALALLENVPAGADRTHALRLIRDAVMWGNKAIALEGIV